MKKIRIIGLFALFVPALALSQSINKTQIRDTLKPVNPGTATQRIVTFAQMDQRKIYHWGNGQRSTPTGREAGEHISKYVKLIGDDSAVVVPEPLDQRR